ncbi:MAG: hypothetical protein ABH875_04575, partial [Candidatus Omnitrophota bacterium]
MYAEEADGLKYAPSEVLVKFKEGSDPGRVLAGANLAFEDLSRIHSIDRAAKGASETYGLKKDSSAWYWFKGKKYDKRPNKISEEEFLDMYNTLSGPAKDLFRTYKIKLSEGTSVPEAVARLSQDPNVEYAEP